MLLYCCETNVDDGDDGDNGDDDDGDKINK